MLLAMTMPKMRHAAALAAATCAVTLAATGVAAADDRFAYTPAEVSFEVGKSSITATITNPNDHGRCYLNIGITEGTPGPDDHAGSWHQFGQDPDVVPPNAEAQDAVWPGPGETKTYTHDELRPDAYDIRATCAATAAGFPWPNPEVPAVTEYKVRVGPEPVAGSLDDGLFGSLGTIFGSLS